MLTSDSEGFVQLIKITKIMFSLSVESNLLLKNSAGPVY